MEIDKSGQRNNFFCVGKSVPKIDALDKVLGRAVYSEDISFPDMLYGRVLRAGIPHAVIEEIDTREAEVHDRGGLRPDRQGHSRHQPLRDRLSGPGGPRRG